MQLRSGKVVKSGTRASRATVATVSVRRSRSPYKTRSFTKLQPHLISVRDPSYNPSPLERAKTQVRREVAARQKKYADKHTEKAVQQVIDTLKMYINEISELKGNTPEIVMGKIRIVTAMFAYANSKSTNTMMHERLGHTRETMLEKAVTLVTEADNKVNEYIRTSSEELTNDEHSAYYDFYMSQLDMMKKETYAFTNVYKTRL